MSELDDAVRLARQAGAIDYEDGEVYLVFHGPSGWQQCIAFIQSIQDRTLERAAVVSDEWVGVPDCNPANRIRALKNEPPGPVEPKPDDDVRNQTLEEAAQVADRQCSGGTASAIRGLKNEQPEPETGREKGIRYAVHRLQNIMDCMCHGHDDWETVGQIRELKASLKGQLSPEPEPAVDDATRAARASVRVMLGNARDKAEYDEAPLHEAEFNRALSAYNAQLDAALSGPCEHCGQAMRGGQCRRLACAASRREPEPASRVQKITCKYCGRGVFTGGCYDVDCVISRSEPCRQAEPASRVEQWRHIVGELRKFALMLEAVDRQAKMQHIETAAQIIDAEISKETS